MNIGHQAVMVDLGEPELNAPCCPTSYKLDFNKQINEFNLDEIEIYLYKKIYKAEDTQDIKNLLESLLVIKEIKAR